MSAASSAPPTVLSATRRNLAHGANDIYWFLLPPVLPLILREFGLRYTGVGGLVAGYLSVIAVSSMLMGRLSDRVPRRPLIAAGFLTASVCLWAASLSPSLAAVVAFLVPAGIGVSAFHPAAYAAINDTDGARGRSYGVFEASGALAVAVMFLVHGALVSRVGWRGVLAVGAVPGAVIGLVLLRSGGASAVGAISPPPVRPPGLATGMALAVLFVVSVMLRFLGATALNNFYPTFLVRTAGLEPSGASYAMGFGFLGSVAGALISGRASERWGPAPVFLAASALMAPTMLALSLTLPGWLYPLLLVGFGFAASGTTPAQNVIISALTGGRRQGRVFGMLLGMNTLTASLSPLLFGVIADHTSLAATIRISVIPVTAAFAVAFLVLRRARDEAVTRGR